MTQDSSLRMASFLRGHGRALTLEVFAIVFGILLAFFIDAWWDTRGDRARERGYIAGLIPEFEAGQRELETDLRVRGNLLNGWLRVLRSPSPGADSTGVITASLNDYRFYTPAHAVLDDLVASGGLHLLRSDSLRGALLRYGQERDRVATEEATEQRFINQTVVPFVVARAELLPWIPEARRDSLGLGIETPRRDVRALLDDPTFRTIVYLRWKHGDITQRYSARLRGEVLEVLRLLRSERARG